MSWNVEIKVEKGRGEISEKVLVDVIMKKSLKKKIIWKQVRTTCRHWSSSTGWNPNGWRKGFLNSYMFEFVAELFLVFPEEFYCLDVVWNFWTAWVCPRLDFRVKYLKIVAQRNYLKKKIKWSFRCSYKLTAWLQKRFIPCMNPLHQLPESEALNNHQAGMATCPKRWNLKASTGLIGVIKNVKWGGKMPRSSYPENDFSTVTM